MLDEEDKNASHSVKTSNVHQANSFREVQFRNCFWSVAVLRRKRRADTCLYVSKKKNCRSDRQSANLHYISERQKIKNIVLDAIR